MGSEKSIRIVGSDLSQTNGKAIIIAPDFSSNAEFINIISQNNFKADGTLQPSLTISATFTNTEDIPLSVSTETQNF